MMKYFFSPPTGPAEILWLAIGMAFVMWVQAKAALISDAFLLSTLGMSILCGMVCLTMPWNITQWLRYQWLALFYEMGIMGYIVYMIWDAVRPRKKPT